MTPENFVYWLQGYLELSDPKKGLSMKQIDVIEEHIELVIDKVTTRTLQPITYPPSKQTSTTTLPPDNWVTTC